MIYNFNGIEYRTVKKFFSRVNSVFLIERTEYNTKFILKDFEDNSKRLISELAGIRIFKDLSPEIIFYDNRYLVHEFIKGVTFLSKFENAEKNFADPEDLTSSLLSMLNRMYSSAPGFILGDINFTNFIVKEDNSVVFVDYECVCKGELEADIGKICAFALTYNPMFTDWKYKFVRKFIKFTDKIFSASEDKIFSYMEKEFEDMKIRRKLSINISEVKRRI